MNKCFIRSVVVLASLAGGLSLAQSRIDLDPKSASLSGPFVLTNNYICRTLQSEVAKGGRASFTFTLTNSGTYAVQARVGAAGGEHALYVNIDAEPEDLAMCWDVPRGEEFTDRFVTWQEAAQAGKALVKPKTFKLSAGAHQLIIRGRTANTKLALVSLHRLPEPPTGLRVAGQTTGENSPRRPSPPANLRIVSESP